MQAFNLSGICREAIRHRIAVYLVPTGCEHSKHAVGVHVLQPTERELENALETAIKDMFPAIYIHNVI